MGIVIIQIAMDNGRIMKELKELQEGVKNVSTISIIQQHTAACQVRVRTNSVRFTTQSHHKLLHRLLTPSNNIQITL